MKSYTVLILIFSITIVKTMAQSPFIKHYTIADGLPTNTIYHVCQDKSGFLWFATDAGVVRFDGNEFENFTMDDGLNDNEVIRVKQDFDGRLWFFNLNGTLNYYYKNKIYNSANSDLLKKIRGLYQFLDFFQDSDSTFYFYNLKSEIIKIGHNLEKFEFYCDSKRNNRDNLLLLNKSKAGKFLLWENFKLTEKEELKDNENVLYNFEDNRRAFQGDSGKCFIYNPKGEFMLFNDSGLEEKFRLPLNSNLVNCIQKVKDGSFWISTFDTGIFCVKNKKIVYHLEIEQGQWIIQDKDDNIWVTSMKNGIYKLKSDVASFIHYDKTVFGNNEVFGLGIYNQPGLWATNGKEIFLVKNNTIYPVFETDCTTLSQIYFNQSDCTLMLSGNTTHFYALEGIRFDKLQNRVAYNRFVNNRNYTFKKFAFCEKKDELYIYNQNMVVKINNKGNYTRGKKIILEGRINNFFFNSNDELVISSSKIYVYKNDSIGEDNTLSRFNGEIITEQIVLNDSLDILNLNGKHLYLKYKNNLYNLTDSIQQTVDYKIKKLANCGSMLFFSDIRTVYIISNPLDIIDSSPLKSYKLNIEFNNINDIKCNDSILYVASGDGLTLIPVRECIDKTNHLPGPYFKKIMVNEKVVDISGGNICFKGLNSLTIGYSAINYSSFPTVFFYRMVGMEKEWNIGGGNELVYQNLTPGQYTFQLRAGRNDELISNPLELHVEVLPTLPQRLVFWIGVVVLTIFLILVLTLFLINRRLKQKKAEHLMVSLEHKAVQAMMNPHFIFNSLGSIQNFLLQNKTDEAGLYLSQFARLIRQNLNSLNSNFVTIEDETDRLTNYLDLEKFRMSNKFDYSIETDPEIDPDEILIPSMVIQPFVENAIWHGISALEKGGLIHVKFFKQFEKTVRVFIEDNGIGMKKAGSFSKTEKHLHMGMELTRKRMELLGTQLKVKSGVEAEELYPGKENPGTRIKLILPVLPDSPKM